MRFWQFFLRNLKETYRDPLALGALLAFPLLFMVVFGATLGSNNVPSYNVAVVDNDVSPISSSFMAEALSPILTLNISSESSAEDALTSLKDGDILAFLVIPPGFGEMVSSIRAGGSDHLILDLTYDKSEEAISFEIAQTINAALCELAAVQIPVTINARPADIQAKVTPMGFLATGIIVFGLLIMIPTSARIMARDKESGCLSRLLTTPTRPWEFISGYSLCLLLIAVIQIILFLILGWLFGMSVVGNLAIAFLVFTLTAIASIGLGMAVAAIAKSATQAETLTWLVSMPFAALSGVWFSITMMPRYVQFIANLFPYAHAVEAARAVLLRGAGLTTVGGELIFLTSWAIGAILLGIFLFGRTMRA